MAAGSRVSSPSPIAITSHPARAKKRSYADIAFLAKSSSSSYKRSTCQVSSDSTVTVTRLHPPTALACHSATSTVHTAAPTAGATSLSAPLFTPSTPTGFSDLPPPSHTPLSVSRQSPPMAALFSGQYHTHPHQLQLLGLLPPPLPLPPAAITSLYGGHNVCAQCGASFRLTADLVNHMRQQHRGQSIQRHQPPLPPPASQCVPPATAGNTAQHTVVEPTVAGSCHRQQPLPPARAPMICEVCGETFRERHHLTRHMTAHRQRQRKNKHDHHHNTIVTTQCNK